MKLKISGKIGKLDPLKIKVLRFIGLSEKEASATSETGITAGSTEPATPFPDYSIETLKAQTSAHACWMTLDRPR